MPQGASEEPTHESRNRERLILLILAAVQFTTIVDFMIVMPLGPQLMRTLEIGPAEFGLIVSSYTFAAGAAGLVASSIVDRFARRTHVHAALRGLSAGHAVVRAGHGLSDAGAGADRDRAPSAEFWAA